MLRLPEIKGYYSKPACTLLENNHSNTARYGMKTHRSLEQILDTW